MVKKSLGGLMNNKGKGAIPLENGDIHFSVLAPKAKSVSVVILNEGKENQFPN